MGISRFFTWIKNNFKGNIHKLLEEFTASDNVIITEFHIDANAIIHPIAQYYAKYNLQRELTVDDLQIRDDLSGVNPETIWRSIYELVGKYLISAMLAVKPKRVFQIAIDGVAPMAKLAQQRMRRLKSRDIGINYFDPVMISPGTPFMDGLQNYIETTWIEENLDKFPKDLQIVLSSHREAGEGEHKIMEILGRKIKGSRDTAKMKPYIVINSADSDLIVLSLTRQENIIFMRDEMIYEGEDMLETAIDQYRRGEEPEEGEDPWVNMFSEKFLYVDTARIKQTIQKDMTARTNVDFSLIALFVGNDFLPAVPETEAVFTRGFIYMTDYEIMERFRSIDKNFDRNKYQAEFHEIKNTWREEANAIGLRNNLAARDEIYPFRIEPLTGIKRRYMKFRNDGEDRWTTAYDDVGSLTTMLTIYTNLLTRLRKTKGFNSSDFLVKNNSQINYYNLATFLEELMRYSTALLESQIEQYNYMTYLKEKASSDPDAVGVIPNLIVPASIVNPTIDEGLGILSSSYIYNYNHKSFGIYDSKYADPELPKQSIDEQCRKWLEGVNWTLRYYNSGHKQVSKTWFYPFLSSPSIFDLHKYITERLIPTPEINFPRMRIPFMDTEILGLVRYNLKDGTATEYVSDMGQYVLYFESTDGEDSYFVDREKVNIQTNRKSVDIPGTLKIMATSINKISVKVRWDFVEEKAIHDVISTSTEYSDISVSSISIFPLNTLEYIFGDVWYIVEQLLNKISDMFPDKFESILEGKFYTSQAIVKVPYASLTRIKRILQSVDEEELIEVIKAMNIKSGRKEVIIGRLGSKKPYTVKQYNL